jgi:predicted phage tail protein
MFSATNAGGFFGFAARTVLGIGINMILGSLFSQGLKKPEKPDAPVEQERRNNDMFEGLQNTTDTDKMVQLNYGQVRVAGQLVSGYIETISHGQNDNISVSNYV